jgi:hypothetical protein
MHEKAEKLPAGAGSGGVQKMPYKYGPKKMPGEGAKGKPISDFTMPYKKKPGDKNPIIDMKRKELAKKKAEIIKGQNSQTAAGSDGALMESLKNIKPSKPRAGNRYL